MVYPNVGGLLFGILPAWVAYGLVIIGATWLGGWYTYRLCREHLGLGERASTVAGVLWSYALITADVIPYLLGFGALPVALYYLEALARAGKPWCGRAFLLGIAFAFFSSVPFTLPFTLAASALWFVAVRKHTTRSANALFSLFALGAIQPHIPEVGALAVNAPLSNRGGDFYNAPWSYGLSTIIYLLRSYWFVIALAAAGFLVRSKERAFRGAFLLGALFLVVAPWYQPFATRFGQYFLLVKDFGFDRFYFLAPFFFAIAGGFTLHHLTGTVRVRQREYEKSVIAIAALAVALVGALGMQKVAHARVWLREGSFYAATHSPAIEKIRELNMQEPFRVATIADERTGLRPTLANMNGWETIDGDINIASRRYVEFFKALTQNPAVEPKHSFYLLWQAGDEERAQAASDASALLDPALLSLANVRFLLSPFPVFLTGFQLLHAPAVAADAPSFKEAWKINTRGRDLYLYENSAVFSRAFLVDDAEKIPDVKKVHRAEIIFYTHDKIEMTTASSTPGVLVLTNNYNPGWHVLVDGEEKKIMPVYTTFMGISLEGGNHTVVWKYTPESSK